MKLAYLTCTLVPSFEWEAPAGASKGESMLLHALEDLATEVGRAIMPLFESGLYQTESKADLTPVTEADLLADSILQKGLRLLEDIPILSEEGARADARLNPERFWVIDPIDGTKEFIQKRPSFTVNIALIEAGVPIVGVVYAPALNELYAGSQAGGLRFNRQAVAKLQWPAEPTLVGSRSHPEDELATFMTREGFTRFLPIGSSLKFCWVAYGKAHCYPRFRSLSSWDTAAGHAVALAGGCEVLEMASGMPFLYGFQQHKSPPFCVIAPGTQLHAFPHSPS